MSDSPTDEQLVLVARAGPPKARAAFEALVRRHEQWLVGYVRFLLSDSSRADDVAQDVFVRAHASLGALAEPAKFRGWLRTMATRLAFNHRRDRGVRSRYEASQSVPLPAPLRAPDAQDDRDAVLAALSLLPYAYREILVLRYIEELPLDEIADQLDLGLSAVKMRLSRAREAFKPLYAGVTHGK